MSKLWTEEECDRAAELLREVPPINQHQVLRSVARMLGRSLNSVRHRYKNFGPSFKRPGSYQSRRTKLWTEEECDRAAEIMRGSFNRSRTMSLVAQTLDRTYRSVQARFAAYGSAFKRLDRIKPKCDANGAPLEEDGVFKIHIPPEVLAEKAVRIELEHASVTAALCGDPLPGYSALDRAKMRQRHV